MNQIVFLLFILGRCAASPTKFPSFPRKLSLNNLRRMFSSESRSMVSDGGDVSAGENRTSKVDQPSPTTAKRTLKQRPIQFSLWRKGSKVDENSSLKNPSNETTNVYNQTEATDNQNMEKVNRTQEESPYTSVNITQHVAQIPSSTAQNATPTIPSYILLQRPPRQSPMGYYKGGLVVPSSPIAPLHSPSSTESGLVVIISALLPILSKLALLLLLSGSSIFFGPNDMHPIYSPNPTQHFMLERVNDRYSRDDIAIQRAIRFPPTDIPKRLWNILLNRRRRILKRSRNSVKRNDRNHRHESLYTRTVLVVDVHTEDIHSTVEYLRDAVSFILHQYHSMDSRLDFGTELEVLFNVESAGGSVQDYGLAADQIARLRNSGKENGDLIVTVCVDKIAASGGYMIACQSSPGKLLAAPFAVVGSIGVLRETLNIYEVLTKYGIRPLLIKAGKAKVPITSTNEVTKEGLAFVQKNVDSTHELFKKMVLEQRGDAMDPKHFTEITSGDVFLGTNALALGLVDRLISSDEYISERIMQGDRVLRLQKYDKSRAGMRFSPLDLLLSYKDGFLQGKLPWIQKYLPLIGSIFKLGLSASIMKALDFV